MGFWDAALGDLEAVGVRVTPEQEHVLEQGGEVLVIRGLLSPWHGDRDYSPVTDQNAETIYVPQLLRAMSMTSVRAARARAHLNREFGPVWRAWPSYAGLIKEKSYAMSPWVEDRLSTVRVWDGTPLITTEDYANADTLYQAVIDRICATDYERIYSIHQEYCIEDAINRLCDEEDLFELTDEEGQFSMSLAVEYLNEIVSAPLVFESMDVILKNDQPALRMWNRLVNRRENSLAIIAQSLPQRDACEFDDYERETM